MAGLVPAIHVFAAWEEGVDVRHKAGHDEAISSGWKSAQSWHLVCHGLSSPLLGNLPFSTSTSPSSRTDDQIR